MAIQVGEKAPHFKLKNQHGKEVSTKDFAGKNIVLSFHPLAFTRVCTYQMQDLEKHKEDFDKLNSIALGISVDPVPAKHAWAKEIGVKETFLLSDFWPHGELAKAYGIFRETEGFSERAVIIIDQEGIIRWVKVYPTSEKPPIEEIVEELKKIN